MSNWSTSNYRQRKAARRATAPAQWFTNPETDEKFLIRPMGAMVSLLAHSLPSALKQEAVEGWQKHGIAAPEGESSTTLQRSAQEADQINQQSAKLIYDACVIPTLTAIGEEVDSIQRRALANCEIAFADDETWKNASKEEKIERASDVVLPLADLEESDAKFILRQAYGYSATVPMQGGQVMSTGNLARFPKKPGRRARTGTGG